MQKLVCSDLHQDRNLIEELPIRSLDDTSHFVAITDRLSLLVQMLTGHERVLTLGVILWTVRPVAEKVILAQEPNDDENPYRRDLLEAGGKGDPQA
jgi:hypothetical protein